jgi:predicted Zn-dependent peptidase
MENRESYEAGTEMKNGKNPTVSFESCQLGNGLMVIIHENRRIPLVHVNLHYRVGSSYERPGLSGFAHLFEHMMFQGSENVPRNEHGRLIDNAGGRWNAGTNKDRTNYFETVPAHYLDLALWLEADRMKSLEVNEENFENQRKTVIEEKKQSYDNRPYGLSYLRFDELAYQNWAYAHPIIGSLEDLESASLEDAQQFHRRFYGPGNAVLVISGDIDTAYAISRVEKYFESVPDNTSVIEPDLEEPAQAQEKSEVMADALAVLPAVSVGYHIPPLGTPDYYALMMLSLVLADGDSSRLYRRFVYENNWVTGLFAGPNQYKGPGMFRIWFQIQDGVDTGMLMKALEDELNRICDKGVREPELEKARNQVSHRFIARLSTVSRVGELLAYYASYFGAPDMVNSELERLGSVSAEEIEQAARRTFVTENRTLILTEPRNQ